jgi:hypothetical protein
MKKAERRRAANIRVDGLLLDQKIQEAFSSLSSRFSTQTALAGTEHSVCNCEIHSELFS